MPEFLLLRLEGPLQAWGDVALDPRRPTLPFPSRSGLAGLCANALGWRYRDAARTTALQDSLRYAVREDRRPTMVVDFQTADLDDPRKDPGWTAWGPEVRKAGGTHILNKHYLADACFEVALTLDAPAPVTLSALADALRRPARPLFLGRKSCPPAGPILAAVGLSGPSPQAVLARLPAPPAAGETLRLWYETTDPTAVGTTEVWDRRDHDTNRFTGARRVAEERLAVADLPQEVAS